MNYDSIEEIKKLLRENNVNMQKKFGQNFLINSHARNKIVDEIGPCEEDFIWEIGPGIGSLTHVLLQKSARVKVFEIDYGFLRILDSFFGNDRMFTAINGDFLKTWPGELEHGLPSKICGNLPYNVGSQMIASLLESMTGWGRMVFMVQKEVADRMTASPGTKDFSSFSVFCQGLARVENCFVVKAGAFYPQPEVTSAVVRLMPRKPVTQDVETVVDPKLFSQITRGLFQSRRKTIQNNLKNSDLLKEFDMNQCFRALEAVEIKKELRAEALDVGKFVNLANYLVKIRERH